MIIYDMYDKILDHVIFFVCFNYYKKLKYIKIVVILAVIYVNEQVSETY